MSINAERLRLELSRAVRPLGWLAVLASFAVVAVYVIFSNITFTPPWSSDYVVRLAVDDASGVSAGQQVVKLAGVDVGLVKQVQIHDGRPVLTLSIKPRYAPLYRDARFRIRPLTPLEDMYVSIDSRGTKAAGVLHASELVPADQTVPPVGIGAVLDTFQPSTRTAMAITLNELARGTADNGANLRAAFIQLGPFLSVAQGTLGAVAQRRNELAHLGAKFGSLLDAVGARDRQLAQLITAGDSSLGQLARNDRPFAQTLAQLPPTMTEMRSAFGALRSSEATLDPALSSLEPVAAHLATGLSALRGLAAKASPALVRLRPALTALAPLARALRPAATDLNAAFGRLQPQAPKFDHITALVPPCFSWISQFFNNTLSVMKYSDAYGTIPRGNNTTDYSTFGGTGTGTLTQREPCTGAVR
jgi:virulence factor Mce-like protein